jgi:hypothetical protein
VEIDGKSVRGGMSGSIVAVQCRPDRQSAVAVTEAKIVSQPVEE